MIIDFHTHTFPDHMAQATVDHLSGLCHCLPFTDGTAAGLRTSMARAGVDLSVCLPVATNPRQVDKLNRLAAQQNEHWRETGIFSLGCIHPLCPDPRPLLQEVSRLGLRGVKIHPAYQEVYIDDPRFLKILALAGELGLFVVTHAGVDLGLPSPVYCHVERIARALELVGPVPMVLAHMGGWRQWDQVVPLFRDLPHVSIDTAFALGDITPLPGRLTGQGEREMLAPQAVMDMIAQLGAGRVLMGSDSPWDGQGKTVDFLRALPLAPTSLDAVLGGNAMALLGL